MENGRGLIKALENWAKKITDGYRDVEVRDLSTSFRDGMAFCAIIHHYRPDIIDFDSLSKENIFENNSLAFGMAEKQLGVPALLDAEDMVKYSRPDRLSIITYLSQLRNCFENQNRVKMKTDLKRIEKQSPGPPTKVSIVEPFLIAPKRHEVCQVCKHRVFILERLIVDGKLYHTTCFRCHKCNCLLNPGAYVESDIAGVYECSVCVADEIPNLVSQQLNIDEVSVKQPLPRKEFIKNDVANTVRSKFSPQSQSVSEILTTLPHLDRDSSMKSVSASSLSVKDKIHAFEKNQPIENSYLNASAVTPADKTCQSLVLSSSYELSLKLSNSYSSQQTLSFDESLKKLSPDKVNESVTASSQNNLVSSEKTSAGKSYFEISDIQDDDVSDKDCDKLRRSSITENNLECKVSLKEANVLNSNDNDVHVTKTCIESPKATRDIFKTSLQPLKFPSIIRKENLVIPRKNIDNLSFQSSSLLTLPTIRRNLSFTEDPSKTTVSHPDSNLVNNSQLQTQSTTRRNSLESSECDTTKNISQENWSKPGFKTFNRTISAQEVSLNSATNNFRKSPLRTYTSVYRSLLGASNDCLIKSQDDAITNQPLSSESLCQSENDFCSTEKLDSDDANVVHLKLPEFGHKDSSESTNKKLYPDDMNPFGEDDTEENSEEYPDDLNPFGDDDSIISDVEYDEAKNPFASDDEDHIPTSASTKSPLFENNKSPIFTDSIWSNVSSPSNSIKGTLKKRPAPKPPALSDIFPESTGVESSLISAKSSPIKKPFQASSPKVRKNKPAPPPPPDSAASSKMTKEADNLRLKSSKEERAFKKKKRPAPPVPIPMRRDMKKIPLKEILQEMKEIEEKQREYERQGREIELLIRDRDKDDEASVEEEEYIMQLFELVNQKNSLFRRQAELMYIKRSQRLEEQQQQIEKEIRHLMEKPESEKTDEDRQKEEELTLELIDIVDQRNSIIDSIEMDRRRELEEDHSVQEQLEIKNGDLPIPAEIKQKSSGKNKKSKAKKEKKKQESGKDTLKKKKLFSRRS